MRSDHYVYVLFRENGTPFYVGMGRGNRWLAHEKIARQRRSHKDNIICAMRSAGRDIPKIKVREGLTREAAIDTEISLIAAIGREPVGPLVNQTSGGEGTKDMSPEAIERIRTATKTRLTSPEGLEKHSAGQKRRYASAEQRKLSAKNSIFANASAAQRKEWLERPGAKARMDESLRARWDRPGAREEFSENARRRQSSDQARALMSESVKRRFTDPEERNKIASGLKAYLATPEGKAARSASQKLSWIGRKARAVAAAQVTP